MKKRIIYRRATEFIGSNYLFLLLPFLRAPYASAVGSLLEQKIYARCAHFRAPVKHKCGFAVESFSASKKSNGRSQTSERRSAKTLFLCR